MSEQNGLVDAVAEQLNLNGLNGTEDAGDAKEDEQTVTPWAVVTTSATGVDYQKLIRKSSHHRSYHLIVDKEKHYFYHQNRAIRKPAC